MVITPGPWLANIILYESCVLIKFIEIINQHNLIFPIILLLSLLNTDISVLYNGEISTTKCQHINRTRVDYWDKWNEEKKTKATTNWPWFEQIIASGMNDLVYIGGKMVETAETIPQTLGK